MTVGDRIRQARELRGLTQSSLAKALDLNQSAVAHMEGGRNETTEEYIKAIAFQTGFPPAFFMQGAAPAFSEGSLMFRARAAMTARERQQAYRFAQLLYEIAERFCEELETIPVRLPHLEEEPITAARIMRASLGIAENSPVPEVIAPLEQFGVFVLALPLKSQTQDAFSLWAGKEMRPVIALFADKSGDRIRWNVSHELRHLTVRTKGSMNEIERDADRFAAEFLMPERAMFAEITTPVTLPKVLELKSKWGVSIQALVRRAFELNIVSDRQYYYLFEQIGRKGWRSKEPLALAIEKPRALRKMAETIYGVPLDYRQLAMELKIPYALTRDLFEGHAGLAATKSQKAGKILKFSGRVSSSSECGRPS
jgi:Zn-dependent peptidase ImmA (M78 family)/transcriptional regulator with XRE-family HTH domain